MKRGKKKAWSPVFRRAVRQRFLAESTAKKARTEREVREAMTVSEVKKAKEAKEARGVEESINF